MAEFTVNSIDVEAPRLLPDSHPSFDPEVAYEVLREEEDEPVGYAFRLGKRWEGWVNLGAFGQPPGGWRRLPTEAGSWYLRLTDVVAHFEGEQAAYVKQHVR